MNQELKRKLVLINFAGKLNAKMDPQGLVYVISTGRYGGSQINEITEPLGIGRVSRNVIQDLLFYVTNYKSGLNDNDLTKIPKRIQKLTEEITSRIAREITERHPLYNLGPD